MSFDALTGDLIAGDVGQGAIEEVNIITKGGNYGWNLKEGSFLFDVTATGQPFVTTGPDPISGLIDPIFEYDHDEGVAVIGGFVYRGTAIPELAGKYIFGELGGPAPRRIGRLFAGDLSTGLFEELRIGPGDRSLGQRLLGIGEDEQGELYVLASPFDNPPGGNRGTVFQITAVPEPTGLTLMGIGGFGLLAYHLLRRKGTRSRKQGGPTADEARSGPA